MECVIRSLIFYPFLGRAGDGGSSSVVIVGFGLLASIFIFFGICRVHRLGFLSFASFLSFPSFIFLFLWLNLLLGGLCGVQPGWDVLG